MLRALAQGFHDLQDSTDDCSQEPQEVEDAAGDAKTLNHVPTSVCASMGAVHVKYPQAPGIAFTITLSSICCAFVTETLRHHYALARPACGKNLPLHWKGKG